MKSSKQKTITWIVVIVLALMFLGPFIAAACIVVATFQALRDVQ